MLKRLVIELPFVAFAFLMPFIARGPQVEVLGLSLSVEGLWGAWNILVKGTLGIAASIVVASTTTMAELIRGLDRLRMLKAFTSIATFMIRYFDVISDEMQLMRIARESRMARAVLGRGAVLAGDGGPAASAPPARRPVRQGPACHCLRDSRAPRHPGLPGCLRA